ncbi:hypothetical protein KR009_007073 [Drosophila setifemur]|nr:hypothetical protein KR009_007073 [Drosophila setifemur]
MDRSGTMNKPSEWFGSSTSLFPRKEPRQQRFSSETRDSRMSLYKRIFSSCSSVAISLKDLAAARSGVTGQPITSGRTKKVTSPASRGVSREPLKGRGAAGGGAGGRGTGGAGGDGMVTSPVQTPTHRSRSSQGVKWWHKWWSAAQENSPLPSSRQMRQEYVSNSTIPEFSQEESFLPAESTDSVRRDRKGTYRECWEDPQKEYSRRSRHVEFLNVTAASAQESSKSSGKLSREYVSSSSGCLSVSTQDLSTLHLGRTDSEPRERSEVNQEKSSRGRLNSNLRQQSSPEESSCQPSSSASDSISVSSIDLGSLAAGGGGGSEAERRERQRTYRICREEIPQMECLESLESIESLFRTRAFSPGSTSCNRDLTDPDEEFHDETDDERFYRHMLQLYNTAHILLVDYTRRKAIQMREQRDLQFGPSGKGR